jgi:hypothetical protein
MNGHAVVVRPRREETGSMAKAETRNRDLQTLSVDEIGDLDGRLANNGGCG